MMTGMPATSGAPDTCPTIEPYARPVSHLADLFPGPQPNLCLVTHGSWALLVLTLWGLALVGCMLELRHLRRNSSQTPAEMRSQRATLHARLMLLVSGALWLAFFSLSYGGQLTPRGSSRYLED